MTSKTSNVVRLPPLPTIRDILRLYNLNAIRKLSQNFLLDENLNNKIVKCAGKLQGTEICEIGPGPGNITRSILTKGAEKVFLIEKDPRFLPTLQVTQNENSLKMLLKIKRFFKLFYSMFILSG